MSNTDPAIDEQQERSYNSSLNEVFEEAIQATPEHRLRLAESEADDHKRAAVAMANALRDIYNEIGFMEEVESNYDPVHLVVNNYTE